jgi:hypothetical protein
MAKDGYDKFEAVAKGLGVVAIPFVIGYAGQLVQRQVADEGLKKDYVQIAVSILNRENPTGQEKDVRRWAVKVLDKLAPVPMTDATKLTLESSSLAVLTDAVNKAELERVRQCARETASLPPDSKVLLLAEATCKERKYQELWKSEPSVIKGVDPFLKAPAKKP